MYFLEETDIKNITGEHQEVKSNAQVCDINKLDKLYSESDTAVVVVTTIDKDIYIIIWDSIYGKMRVMDINFNIIDEGPDSISLSETLKHLAKNYTKIKEVYYLKLDDINDKNIFIDFLTRAK